MGARFRARHVERDAVIGETRRRAAIHGNRG